MKVLAVNAGSSSLKFQMYEMPEEKVLISGVFERIGIGNSFYTIKLNGEKIRKDVELANHSVAVGFLTKELLENNIVDSLEEIKGVGHRIVQGADKFDRTVIINGMVEDAIDELSALAPLHNPAALVGIKAFKECQTQYILQFLIQHFIKLCQKKHLCMHFHMNGILNMVLENMEHMVLVINMYQEELMKFWVEKTLR